MKLVFQFILITFPVFCSAQFKAEDFLGQNEDKMIIEYADKYSKNHSITSFNNMPVRVDVKLTVDSNSIFTCGQDTINCYFDFFYEVSESAFRCRKIICSADSSDCTFGYLANFILRTSRLKWRPNGNNGWLTSKYVSKFKVEKEVLVSYWEVNMYDNTFILVEKIISKKEWKGVLRKERLN